MDLTLIEELETRRAPGIEPFTSGQWCPIGDCPEETTNHFGFEPLGSGSLPSDDTPIIPPRCFDEYL